jgi:hypothetical protein
VQNTNRPDEKRSIAYKSNLFELSCGLLRVREPAAAQLGHQIQNNIYGQMGQNNILRRKHFEIVNFQSPKGLYLYTWLMVDKKYSMASERVAKR